MKAKLKLTATLSYELKPELYPQGFTKKEMLAADIANYEDDPAMLLDMCDSITVTGSTQPELSRFLPEGYKWVQLTGGWIVANDKDLPFICIDDKDREWFERGLTPPSEGGGFQRVQEEGTSILKNGVDIITRNGITFEASENHIHCCYDQIEGWRPHFEKGGES